MLSPKLVLAVFTAFTLSAQLAAEAKTIPEELLADPDFSSDASSWFLQDATLESLDPSSGAQQVHLRGLGTSPRAESHVGTEVKPLPIDHDMTFSCQVRGTQPEQHIAINAYAYDASHRELKSWFRIITVKPGEWTPFSARYIPPANADCIVLWIVNKSGKDAYVSHPSMLLGDPQTSAYAEPTGRRVPSGKPTATGEEDHANEFDAIIAKLATRYGACKTYRDTGVARDPGRQGDRETFDTWFVRPNSFRFDWSDFRQGRLASGADKSAVWSNDNGAFSSHCFNNNKVEKEKNLEMAVAGAAGVSRGVVYTIYNFLFKDPRQRSLFVSNDWTVTDDEFAGRPAYLLVSKQKPASGEFSEVWITKDDFVMRKVREHMTITEGFQKEVLEKLKQHSPDLYERSKTLPTAERHYVQETVYENVLFDEEIPESAFHPEFKQ